MNTGYPGLDAVMNDGWNQFIQTVRDNNDRCNYRLLKLVEKIKGELFVTDLKVLLNRVDYGMLGITRVPIGVCVGENRFATIPKVWIDQRVIDGNTHGSLCIQVKPDRWIIANYVQ